MKDIMMDPDSGKLYAYDEIRKLHPELQKRLVRIEGNPKDIRKIVRHVKKGTRKDKEHAKKKAQKLARKKNR